MAGPHLRLTLEAELPDELSVGRGSAVFVCGWCFCAEAAIESLASVVDAREQAAAAHSMPRLDPLRALHPGLALDAARDPQSSDDPELRSYRSGFWGLVELPPRAPGELTMGWRARLRGGPVAEANIGAVQVVEPPPPLAYQRPDDDNGGP